MGIRPSSGKNENILVNRHIGTAYDDVKLVADSLDIIENVAENIVNTLKYLGASSTHPDTRLDGSPIVSGDYYLNTTKNTLTYYNAEQDLWLAVDPSEILAARNETLLAASEAALSRDAADLAKISAESAASTASLKAADAITSAEVALAAQVDASLSKTSAETAANTAVIKATESATSAIAAEGFSQIAEGASAAAESHANIATTQATTATVAADAANTSKLAAKASEDASKTSETLSEAWASNPEDLVVAAGEYSSKHYALKSASSASLSSNSASAAEISKNIAEVSATTATTQAGIATTAATSATASAEEASLSAASAKTDAAIATTKAAEAEVSSTSAENSKVAAGISAVAANASADRAEVAAGTAGGGMIDGGGCDLSGGTFPPPIVIQGITRSSIWSVSVGGSVNGTEFSPKDGLMYSAVLSGYFKLDNTFISEVLSINGQKGDVVLSAADVGALAADAVALSAAKWETARTISLDGSVVGSVSLDGSSNVTISTNLSPTALPIATLTVKGITQLSDAIDSADTTKAATPSAVKAAYDKSYSKAESDAKYQISGSYAPLSHGHNIGQITGLQDALNTKVNKSDKATTTTEGVTQLSNKFNGTLEDKAVTEKALSDGLGTRVPLTGNSVINGNVTVDDMLAKRLVGLRGDTEGGELVLQSAPGFEASSGSYLLDVAGLSPRFFCIGTGTPTWRIFNAGSGKLNMELQGDFRGIGLGSFDSMAVGGGAVSRDVDYTNSNGSSETINRVSNRTIRRDIGVANFTLNMASFLIGDEVIFPCAINSVITVTTNTGDIIDPELVVDTSISFSGIGQITIRKISSTRWSVDSVST